MYWIQEMGQATGANRLDYKLFYCENLSELTELPTTTTEGNIAYALDGCEDYIKKVKVGDQCFMTEDSSVWVMLSDNSWKQI